MSAQPWFKFFPADWRSDSALRMCSPGARCLWLEMLCIMYEAEPCGHLLIKGRALNDRMLAVQAGMTVDEVSTGLAELEENGVYSRTADGTIYSRKMVRDARRSEEQRQRAAARWSSEKIDETEPGIAETMPDAMPAHMPTRARVPEARSQKLKPESDSLSPNGDSSLFGKEPDHAQDALGHYNLMAQAHGLPIAAKLTDKRRTMLRARLREHGLPEWIRAVESVPRSDFLSGRSTSFRADLDFLLQPSKFQRVLEGFYEGSRNERPSAPTDRAARDHDAMVEGARQASAAGRGRPRWQG